MRNGFVPCCYDNAPCRGRFHRIHEGRKGLRSLPLSLSFTRDYSPHGGDEENCEATPARRSRSRRSGSPPCVASSKRNVPPLTIESIFLRLIWLSTSATHIASSRINVARFSTVAFIALFPFPVGSYLRWRKKEEFLRRWFTKKKKKKRKKSISLHWYR